ncbi:unnamed protein product, partial [Ectocarpus sp. 4 AP-2014]
MVCDEYLCVKSGISVPEATRVVEGTNLLAWVDRRIALLGLWQLRYSRGGVPLVLATNSRPPKTLLCFGGRAYPELAVGTWLQVRRRATRPSLRYVFSNGRVG